MAAVTWKSDSGTSIVDRRYVDDRRGRTTVPPPPDLHQRLESKRVALETDRRRRGRRRDDPNPRLD
jgi:hypothetical protein